MYDNINEETRKKVRRFLYDKGLSLNSFAKETEIHQPNLHVFLKGKNLSSKNIEKIWKYFKRKGVK